MRRLEYTMRKILIFLISCFLFIGMLDISKINISAETTDTTEERTLLNGSFEDNQTFTNAYIQTAQNNVPYWNTTAFQGRVELFRRNTGTYIKNVILEPTDKTYAAELNADEESTLYQNVKTTPASIYEWGLDHGGRNGMDTMALVIGPKQEYNPSKPDKNGRDQFMQMVDWLISQGLTSIKTEAGLGETLTLYSKKFGPSGTFEDNAGNNAFSLIPSDIYTEEWKIWIMSDGCVSSGTNPWSSYGSNADGSSADKDESGGTTIDTNKYYLYTVPANQTETVFGFVSVGYIDSTAPAEKAKTYGNFLDNINFSIYHQLTGSSTDHGSAVVDSSGNISGDLEEHPEGGYQITVDNTLTSYLKDGDSLKIQAVVRAEDMASCNFVGVYCTMNDSEGVSQAQFIGIYENTIESSGDEEADKLSGKWIVSTNENGDLIYTYYLPNITSAVDLHFVFIKSPMVTYDSNGGKPYVVERTYNLDELENVYSFRPLIEQEDYIFIEPYKAHAAEGQNDGWKFMGWLLTGDTVDSSWYEGPPEITNPDSLNNLLLPAEHTVACNYSLTEATGSTATQFFGIFSDNINMESNLQTIDESITGVIWNPSSDTNAELLYGNVHSGLTMVAQWRWRQVFTPQVLFNGVLTDTTAGGTVEVINVQTDDENYESHYTNEGSVAYFASAEERVIAKATPKEGYRFIGWYDANGNLVTTHDEYSYAVNRETVNQYYARFTNSVTQTYIRQVQVDGEWVDVEDDNVGTIDRYTYTDAAGRPTSATVIPSRKYEFLGWYDIAQNPVDESLLSNNGYTLSYIMEKDDTYYAHFERAYDCYFVAQTKQADGTFKNDTSGGTVSVASGRGLIGTVVTSKAVATPGSRFLGWYDKDGNLLESDNTYTVELSELTDEQTYYARFEVLVAKVVFKKTDEEGNALGGAKYKLELIDSDYPEAAIMVGSGLEIDVPEAGYELALYPGTYKLYEIEAPKGYELSEDILLFEIDNSKLISFLSESSDWSTSDNQITLSNIVCVHYNLKVLKEDAKTGAPLSGVEFTLYRDATEDDEDATIIYTAKDEPHSVVPIAIQLTTLNEDSAYTIFEGLVVDETYYLEESKPKTGYSSLTYAKKVVGTLVSPGEFSIVCAGEELSCTDQEASIVIQNWYYGTPQTNAPFSFSINSFVILVIGIIAIFGFAIYKKRMQK